MKYKAWFWICLSTSIVFIVITIGAHLTAKKAYENALLEWETQIKKLKIELLENYKPLSGTVSPSNDSTINIDGMGTEPHILNEDSIRARIELEREYKTMAEEVERLRQELKDSENRKPTETRNDFEKASGAASILSLFFSFFFRYKDKKSRRIIKDGERDNEIKPIDPVSKDVDPNSSNPDPKQNEETEVEK